MINDTLIDAISQAFIDNGFENVVHYLGGSDSSDVEGGLLLNDLNIDENTIYRLIQPATIDQNSEFMRSSRGLIEQGKLYLFSIATQPKLAVQDIQDWIKLIQTSPVGGFDYPEAVVDLGNVRFWMFRPVGIVNNHADRFGDTYYICEQLIEYACRKIV